MRKIFAQVVGIWLFCGTSLGYAGVLGEQPLDAATITTPGAGTVIGKQGTVFQGCWVENDPNSTTNLVVDSLNTANATTPASTAAILAPGQTYYCPGGTVAVLTADATDSGHKIYGRKW